MDGMRLYQHTNGYWYVEPRRGKKISLRTKDPVEAKKLRKAMERALLEKRLAELDGGKRTPLKEFLAVFQGRHQDIAEPTARMYDLSWRLLMDSLGPSHLVARVNDRAISKFVADCRARGCRPATINSYLQHLRVMLGRAHDWGHTPTRIKLRKIREGRRLPKVFDGQERARILRYAYRNDPEMYRIIIFALWTGARLGEIRTLTWDRVAETSCRVIGKGDRERTIPLRPMAVRALGQRQDIGRAFPRWTESTYSHRFLKICRAVGIEGKHFHNLRHTAATEMLRAGVPIHDVKTILGHASVTTTEIYLRVDQEAVARSMERFG